MAGGGMGAIRLRANLSPRMGGERDGRAVHILPRRPEGLRVAPGRAADCTTQGDQPRHLVLADHGSDIHEYRGIPVAHFDHVEQHLMFPRIGNGRRVIEPVTGYRRRTESRTCRKQECRPHETFPSCASSLSSWPFPPLKSGERFIHPQCVSRFPQSPPLSSPVNHHRVATAVPWKAISEMSATGMTSGSRGSMGAEAITDIWMIVRKSNGIGFICRAKRKLLPRSASD